jgi:hypothetical protein
VLAKVPNVLSHATRSHVTSITKEDSAAGILSELGVLLLFRIIDFVDRFVRKSPLDHAVYLFNGLTEGSGLESCMDVSLKHLVVVQAFVEVISTHFRGSFFDSFGGLLVNGLVKLVKLGRVFHHSVVFIFVN